jgi:hypothetical protein
MIVKTIGRADTNDVIINQPDVSSKHAKVTQSSNDSFLIEDLDSLNGVYINGYRIKKATVSLSDEVKLSEHTIDLRKIFGVIEPKKEIKQDNLDFTSEFAALEKVWNDYQRERIDITKKHNLKTSLIRGGFTFLPLIIFKLIKLIFYQHAEAAEVADFSQNYIVFSILGSTLAVVATGTMTPIEKLTELDEEFRVRYVCPNKKCSRQLGNTPWRSLINPGYCPACKAQYVKQ